MEQVEEMKNGKVYMHGGTVLQISSRLKASVEKKYTSFCIENAGFANDLWIKGVKHIFKLH